MWNPNSELLTLTQKWGGEREHLTHPYEDFLTLDHKNAKKNENRRTPHPLDFLKTQELPQKNLTTKSVHLRLNR